MIITIPTEELIIYVFAGVITLLILWVIRLEVKIKNTPSIKNNQNISNQISVLQKNVADLDEFKQKTNNNFESIDIELKKTIKGIETLRFNPFKGAGIGGNQSFATALIDDNGDGVIISSLYSRDRVSVFAKPVKSWFCEHELSGEEKEVLEKVRANKK